ncbi:MAG TPA: cupin domain-containing protein [Candidatus Binatia bacterium]|nr:cupin domain-containing protein [Candidatus Binatia bacterium]
MPALLPLAAIAVACACAGVADVARAEDAPAAPPILRLDDLVPRAGDAGEAPTGTREVARGQDSSVNAWRVAGSMPPHFHRAHEEVILVERGRVEVTVGDRRSILGPGDAVLVPRGAVHAGRAIGDGEAAGYSVFAPPFDGRDRVASPEPEPTVR